MLLNNALMTTKSLSSKEKITNLITFKLGVFDRYIAIPLNLKYTHQVKNQHSPNACLIFDIEIDCVKLSLQWENDSIIMHCNNQNRVIKDSLLTQEWFLITLATLLSV